MLKGQYENVLQECLKSESLTWALSWDHSIWLHHDSRRQIQGLILSKSLWWCCEESRFELFFLSSEFCKYICHPQLTWSSCSESSIETHNNFSRKLRDMMQQQ